MNFCYSKLTFHILRTADPPPPGAATRVDDGTDELSAAQLDRPHVSMNVWHATHSPQQQNGQQQSRTVKSSHSGFSERGSSCSDLTFSFCLSKILSIFCQPLRSGELLISTWDVIPIYGSMLDGSRWTVPSCPNPSQHLLDPLKSNNFDRKTKANRYLGALLPQSGM